jgi:tRNA (guanine-N7-)-methyltransferase
LGRPYNRVLLPPIAFARCAADIAGMVDIDDEPDVAGARRGAGAFFGRRKGHRLRAHQASLIETLLPRLALDLTTPAPSDLAGLFAAPVEAVHLEIGFGGGERLLGQAEANRRVGFIGCEPFVNGMAKTLAGIAQRGLANIRLHHADATDLLAWLPSAALRRVELMYPDPWPKRRHWKRRFVQDETLKEIARVLQPGGEFRFATDWADYAAWTLEHALRAPALAWNAERADDWRRPWPDFSATRYEAKARREGRGSCYFTFVRV